MNTPFRLIHISDPHFGTTTPEKVLALTERIKSLEPKLVCLSGDVTQRARRTEFIEARNFCEALRPLQVVPIPGNHDISLFNVFNRFFAPYNGFEKILGYPRDSFHRFSGIEILALNSTDPKRHVQGELHPRDAKLFSKFSPQTEVRIVMFHHPMDCNKDVDVKNILLSSGVSHDFFQKSKIDLILSGHIHDPLARLSTTRYPDSARPFVVSVSGTCLSSRIRSGAPNSFHMIDIEVLEFNIQLTITRFDLSPENHFIPVNVSMFVRVGRDHWKPV